MPHTVPSSRSSTFRTSENQAVHFFYFRSRTTDVMESNGWKTLVRDHPHLIDQVFKAFLASTQTPLIGPPRKRQKTS